MVELETTKDRLEMAQASHQRAAEDKEITNKELDRLLEKYERLVINLSIMSIHTREMYLKMV